MNIGSANKEPANPESEGTGSDRPDSALVTYDFAEALAQRGEAARDKAVLAFLELLADPAACRARVELLRQLGQRAEQLREAGWKIPAGEERHRWLDQGVRLVVHTGTFVALRQGQLTADQLVALSLDPDRLWQAHQEIWSLALQDEPTDSPALDQQDEPTDSPACDQQDESAERTG
jgi:hypothetical protein